MKNEINFNIIDNDNNTNNMNNELLPRNVKIPFLYFEDNNSDKDSVDNDDINKAPIFDLNKLFHFNISYNFEVLKTLLETLILNQQEGQKELLKLKKDNEIKINELENKIIDLKIKISNPQKLEELKKEKEKIIIESEKIKKKVIKEKNLLRKEEKEKENYKIILDNLAVSI